MSETRRNPITGDEVILAPDRGSRPGAWSQDEAGAASCPFCPGNEEETPPEIDSSGNGEWQNRVVPNKYPAVDYLAGVQAHEVIIETRAHNLAFESMQPDCLTETVTLWRQRAMFQNAAPDRRYVAIFRNDGRAAGQSNPHPHSQVIALDHVPPRIAKELAAFNASVTCPMCDTLCDRSTEELSIEERGDLVLFCPRAGRVPYEMWISGRAHTSSWLDADPEDLSWLLGSAVKRLRRLHPGAPFNLGLITAPLRTGGADQFHWYAEIIPRLTNAAGFEMTTGGWINIVAPEQASAQLRQMQLADR